MIATLVRRDWENANHTIVSCYFKPASTYRYEAGQYAVVEVPHEDPDIRGTSRTMTLSSSPNDELLKISFKVFPGFITSTFKQSLLDAEPGTEIVMYDALGDLVLPLDTTIPLIFVAGGIGIASFVGMMQWLYEEQENRTISLHYAVSGPDQIVLQQPFDDYAKTMNLTKYLYTPALDEPSELDSWHGTIVHERLTAETLAPAITVDTLVYISGTETMVEAIRVQLLALGIRRDQIVFDFFDGYAQDRADN